MPSFTGSGVNCDVVSLFVFFPRRVLCDLVFGFYYKHIVSIADTNGVIIRLTIRPKLPSFRFCVKHSRMEKGDEGMMEALATSLLIT